MLIEIDRRIINTDAIRSVDLLDGKDKPDTLRITYLNGDTVQVRHSYASLRTMCGAIIPAPPGYQVMTRFEDEASPIIAFILRDETEHQGFPMVPITALGTAGGSMAVVYPSGRCVDEGGNSYESVESYQQAVRDQFGS